MSIDATVCPACAMTIPTTEVYQHMISHDPKPEHYPEDLDHGLSYE